MKRKLFTLCPGCGRRVPVTKVIPGREDAQGTARVKCGCGQFEVPYSEYKVIRHTPDIPGEKAEPYDFLLPMGWDREMWEKFQGYFDGQRDPD